jgi:hypothetical protein
MLAMPNGESFLRSTGLICEELPKIDISGGLSGEAESDSDSDSDPDESSLHIRLVYKNQIKAPHSKASFGRGLIVK